MGSSLPSPDSFDSLPKICPITHAANLVVLTEHFESLSTPNPKGRSDLPGVDMFVSTVNPEKEPPLITANTVLSILTADYSVEKLACYVSNGNNVFLPFEVLAETTTFAQFS
jgi:hypothetical protein